jgi:hypothetical protein
VNEQICRQEVTHKEEVGPKRHKLRKINTLLRCLKYEDNPPRVANNKEEQPDEIL